jgi:hypothetical protein
VTNGSHIVPMFLREKSQRIISNAGGDDNHTSSRCPSGEVVKAADDVHDCRERGSLLRQFARATHRTSDLQGLEKL